MNRKDVDNSNFPAKPAKAARGLSAAPRSADGLPFRNGQSKIGNWKSAIAFTLVEMLVAILILVVGVALIVGVGSMVRENAQSEETKNIQSVLRSALKAYRGKDADDNTETTDNTATTDNKKTKKKPWPPGDGKPDSTAGLLIALRNDKPAREALKRLPRQAILKDSTGREFVMDGFGNRMRYHQTGGLGGAPLLISLGADQKDPTDDINLDVGVH